jgi:hypothetical protein
VNYVYDPTEIGSHVFVVLSGYTHAGSTAVLADICNW